MVDFIIMLFVKLGKVKCAADMVSEQTNAWLTVAALNNYLDRII